MLPSIDVVYMTCYCKGFMMNIQWIFVAHFIPQEFLEKAQECLIPAGPSFCVSMMHQTFCLIINSFCYSVFSNIFDLLNVHIQFLIILKIPSEWVL